MLGLPFLTALCLLGLVAVVGFQFHAWRKAINHEEPSFAGARALFAGARSSSVSPSHEEAASIVEPAPAASNLPSPAPSVIPAALVSPFPSPSPVFVLEQHDEANLFEPAACRQENRHRTVCFNGEMTTTNATASKTLNIAFITQSSGPYNSFLSDLWRSIKEFCFLKHNVHLVAFTDDVDFVLAELQAEDRSGRPNYVTTVHQPRTGWPWDSLGRHSLMLRHEALWRHFDVVFALDSDMLVSGVWDDRALLGPDGSTPAETIGSLNAWFYALPFKSLSYDKRRLLVSRKPLSSAFISAEEGEKQALYYAGGLLGGTPSGFAAILRATVQLSRDDFAKSPKTVALWHDESYINRYFASNPPCLILGPAFVYPEPPASSWLFHQGNAPADSAWSHAFEKHGVEPKLLNLGTRKHLKASVETFQPLVATLPAFMASNGKQEDFPLPINSIKTALSQTTVIITGLTSADDLPADSPSEKVVTPVSRSSWWRRLFGVVDDGLEALPLVPTSAQRKNAKWCQLLALLNAFATQTETDNKGNDQQLNLTNIVVAVREGKEALPSVGELTEKLPNLRFASLTNGSSFPQQVPTPFVLVLALNSNAASLADDDASCGATLALSLELRTLPWLLSPLQWQRFDIVSGEEGLLRSRSQELAEAQEATKPMSGFALLHHSPAFTSSSPILASFRGRSEVSASGETMEVVAVRERFVLHGQERGSSTNATGAAIVVLGGSDVVPLASKAAILLKEPEFETEHVGCWATEAVGLNARVPSGRSGVGFFMARTSFLADEIGWSAVPEVGRRYSGSLDPARDITTRTFFSDLHVEGQARVAICATAKLGE